ncbi:Hsp20/alpha crystallin family protein [Corallococcus exercitus]|uniref:Hsp20/alpha crystallin family protein n=2 Tax=Corallococcus exercitus TaxID=2316736 RepID=A0A3A8ICB9_9BACT|nr:Hsp20/alpha crystallin family protein [Corallococcus exercitus]NOK34602.1 Hsp20/alpha crystallin family protein [Corallococcus exercitus]RKG77474.1 Hsp20/alpha crystallin family protein [Corallococcus exercitus]
MATTNRNPGAQGKPSSPAVKNAQADAPGGSSQESEPRTGSGIARREAYAPAIVREAMPMSPFGLLRRMMEDMDQLFTGFGGRGLATRSGVLDEGLWSPQVDVMVRNGNLIVKADLPGMKQEDIHVELLKDLLVIEGERSFEVEEEEETEGVWSLERSTGSFRRAIPIPEDIDTETVQANFENGVLEISLKLPEEVVQGKRIEVKGGSSEKARLKPGKPIH